MIRNAPITCNLNINGIAVIAEISGENVKMDFKYGVNDVANHVDPQRTE